MLPYTEMKYWDKICWVRRATDHFISKTYLLPKKQVALLRMFGL